jgi:SAM-dependent methyltransferase
MEQVARCPGCDQARFVEVTERGLDFRGERVQACAHCGLFFLSPRMDSEERAAYYEEEYSLRFRGAARPDAAALAPRDRAAQYRAAVLARWGVLRPGTWLLELGCGAGNFLAQCHTRGVAACGVEPSRGYAESGLERGLDIRIGPFPQEHGPRDAYGVIALFHVLEHLPRPLEMLADVRARLAPGGALVVEVPDLDRALGPRWSERYFHRPHLLDFTRATLEQALRRTGFAIEAYDYALTQPRRRHHLLVVARPGEADRAPPTPPGRTLRRVRRWIRISRVTRPAVVRLRGVLRAATRPTAGW